MSSESKENGFGFRGARQDGIGPEEWGITLEQLATLEDAVARTDTMRAVVEDFVKPWTAGSGTGYALKLNRSSPLRAAIMVSHAWDETYHEFFVALKNSGFTGPFWVCALAIYQNEDIEGVKIADQLGPDAFYGPFATVLRQADCMVAIITAQCDIYTRMWCVFEMAIAIDLQLDVHVAQFTEAVLLGGDGYSRERGFGAEQKTSLPLFEWCKAPVKSEAARCGNPALPPNDDEKSIREHIEAERGYEAINLEVEKARLRSVLDLADADGRTHSRRKSLPLDALGAHEVTTSESALFKARFLLEKQGAVLNLLDHLPREQVPDELLTKIIAFDDEKRVMAEGQTLQPHVREELQGRLTSVREYVDASSGERASKRKTVETGSVARS